MSKLNIFLIHTHDSGRLFSPYGFDVPTPNIMNFAKKSTVFRQCFCCAPTCSPSRAAMLTGIYAHQNGMYGLAHRGFDLFDCSQHMSFYFRKNGFNTVLCGIQHETEDASFLGYDDIVGNQNFDMGDPYSDMSRFDMDNTDALCNYLGNYKGNKPLFVSMGFYNTHRVFPPDDGSVDPNYINVPSTLWDCVENRVDMAGYHRAVKVFDDGFGRLLEIFSKYGLWNNSIIIFTTDHGPAFPRMKCSLYDGGIGVACMIYFPGNPSSGKVCDQLISHIDLFPTLCELENLRPPEYLEGKSFVPVFFDNDFIINDSIFAEVNFHASYQPMRCIRTKRYKYIKLFYDYSGPVLSNIDECAGKTLLIDNGLRNCIDEKIQLYDLFFDPNEQHNLVGDRRYYCILSDMEKRLNGWMEKTDDPIIRYGKINRPKKALVNKLSCEDPGIPDWENDDV